MIAYHDVALFWFLHAYNIFKTDWHKTLFNNIHAIFNNGLDIFMLATIFFI